MAPPTFERVDEGSFGVPLAALALAIVRGGALRMVDARAAATGIVHSDGSVGPVAADGLRGKVLAAQEVGVRRVLVPAGQKAMLTGVGGMRAVEASSVDEAVRWVRVVRPRVRVAAVIALALAVLAGPAIRAKQSSDTSAQERQLAGQRAIEHALQIVDDDPRAALGLAAAAARLDEPGTEIRRAMLAARLPQGLRYLPELPQVAEAVSIGGTRILALTARQLLQFDDLSGRWRVLSDVPAHELGAFTAEGGALLGGPDGAVLVDPRAREPAVVTSEPVRLIAAGRGVAVVTSTDRVLFARTPLAGMQRIDAPERLTAITLSDRGELFAAAHRRILRLVRGRLVTDVRSYWLSADPKKPLRGLSVRGDEIVMVDSGGFVTQGNRFTASSGGSDALTALALSPRRRLVVSRQVAEIRDGPKINPFPPLEHRLRGSFSTAALSLDGQRMILAGKQVVLLAAQSGLTGPRESTDSVTFTSDGGVSSFWTSKAMLYRSRPGAEATTHDTPRKAAGFVLLSPDGRRAAQAAPAGVLRTWDLASGERRETPLRIASVSRPVPLKRWLAPLDDGRVAVMAEGMIYLVDPRRPTETPPSYPVGDRVHSAGPGMVILTSDDDLTVVRTRDMRRVAQVELSGERVVELAARADGREVFLGTQSGTIWRWAPERNAAPRRVVALEGGVYALASRGDGKLLAVATASGPRENTQYLVDVEARRFVRLPYPEITLSLSAAISPRGDKLALGAQEPIAAHVLSLRLTAKQACVAAGRSFVPAAIWLAAVGDLGVAQPSCSEQRG